MEKLEKENVEPIVENQDAAVDSIENDTTSKVEDKKTPPTKEEKIKFWLTFAVLQVAIVFVSLSGVMSKMAAGESFLSFRFMLFYGLEIVILGVYAIVWQQIIKRMQLSIAYCNKSITLLWSLVWSVVIFSEAITIKNIIGVLVVILGIVIINVKK